MSSAGIRRTGQGGEQRGKQAGGGVGGKYQNSGLSLLLHHRGPEGGNWEDKREEEGTEAQDRKGKR